MVEVIKAVMKEFKVTDKWGVYIINNVDNYNIYVSTLVHRLRPNEPITTRRSRCFTHMVNLTTKAFIYGKKVEGFIIEAE